MQSFVAIGIGASALGRGTNWCAQYLTHTFFGIRKVFVSRHRAYRSCFHALHYSCGYGYLIDFVPVIRRLPRIFYEVISWMYTLSLSVPIHLRITLPGCSGDFLFSVWIKDCTESHQFFTNSWPKMRKTPERDGTWSNQPSQSLYSSLLSTSISQITSFSLQVQRYTKTRFAKSVW